MIKFDGLILIFLVMANIQKNNFQKNDSKKKDSDWQNNSNKQINYQDNLKNLRAFGFIWAGIFLVIAYKSSWSFLPTLLAILFVTIGLLKPNFFEQSKIMPIWLKFGEIVGKINSKIIIFIMFYCLFTPIGLVLKIFGKDLLSKKLQPQVSSYFKPRTQTLSDMRNQF